MRAPLIAALFITSAAALAQPPDFALLDRNRDGSVTPVEALADPEIRKRFAQFDSDKDSQLSPAEYLAAREDIARRARLDAALAARVKAALAERGIALPSISVESYEGQVRLSGFVPLPDMASRAGRISAMVSGVRTVHNHIGVK